MTLPIKNKNHLKMRGSFSEYWSVSPLQYRVIITNHFVLPAFCVVVANAAKTDYTQNGKNINILGINMEPNVY